MTKKAETTFKEKVHAYLKTLPNCYFTKIQQVAIIGTLDYFIVLAGVPIVMELKKSAKDKLSPLQVYNADWGQKAGAFVVEACPENWQDVKLLLKEISEQKFKQWERISLVCRSK